jgi:uncharacterized protein YndB with AHSA1/START domain
METINKTVIKVQTTVNAPIGVVWRKFTDPSEIKGWYFAHESWHTPKAVNDLNVGGKFLFRMEAKDGSFGFDFEGIYDEISQNEYIEYHIIDGRKVKINFTVQGSTTIIEESFEAESINPVDQQKQGWQAILDNFKKYTEMN